MVVRLSRIPHSTVDLPGAISLTAGRTRFPRKAFGGLTPYLGRTPQVSGGSSLNFRGRSAGNIPVRVLLTRGWGFIRQAILIAELKPRAYSILCHVMLHATHHAILHTNTSYYAPYYNAYHTMLHTLCSILCYSAANLVAANSVAANSVTASQEILLRGRPPESPTNITVAA